MSKNINFRYSFLIVFVSTIYLLNCLTLLRVESSPTSDTAQAKGANRSNVPPGGIKRVAIKNSVKISTQGAVSGGKSQKSGDKNKFQARMMQADQNSAISQTSYYADSWHPHSLVPTFTDQEQGDEMVALASDSDNVELSFQTQNRSSYGEALTTGKDDHGSMMAPSLDKSLHNDESLSSVAPSSGITGKMHGPQGDEFYADEDDDEEESGKMLLGEYENPPITYQEHKDSQTNKFKQTYRNKQHSDSFHYGNYAENEQYRKHNEPSSNKTSMKTSPLTTNSEKSWLPKASSNSSYNSQVKQPDSVLQSQSQYQIQQPQQPQQQPQHHQQQQQRPQQASGRLSTLLGGRSIGKTDVAIEYLKSILESRQSSAGNNQTPTNSSAMKQSFTEPHGDSNASLQQKAVSPVYLTHELATKSSGSNQSENSKPAKLSESVDSDALTSVDKAAGKSFLTQQADAKFTINDVKPTSNSDQALQTQSYQIPTTSSPVAQMSLKSVTQDNRQQLVYQDDLSSVTMPNGTPLGGDYIDSLDEYPRGLQQHQRRRQQQQQHQQQQLLQQMLQVQPSQQTVLQTQTQSQLQPHQQQPQQPQPQQQKHQMFASDSSPFPVRQPQELRVEQSITQAALTDSQAQRYQKELKHPAQLEKPQSSHNQYYTPEQKNPEQGIPTSSRYFQMQQMPSKYSSPTNQKSPETFTNQEAHKDQGQYYDEKASLQMNEKSPLNKTGGIDNQDRFMKPEDDNRHIEPINSNQAKPIYQDNNQRNQQPISSKIYRDEAIQLQSQRQTLPVIQQHQHQQQYQHQQQHQQLPPQPQQHQQLPPLQQQISTQPLQQQQQHQQQPEALKFVEPQPSSKQKPPKIVSYNYFENPSETGESGELMATNYQLGDALYSSTGGVEQLLSPTELEAIQNQFITAEHPIVHVPESQQQRQSLLHQMNNDQDSSLAGLLANLKPNNQPESLQKLSSPNRQVEEAMKELASEEEQVRVPAPFKIDPSPFVQQPANDLNGKQYEEGSRSAASKQQIDSDVKKKKSLIVYLNHPRPVDMSTKASVNNESLGLAQSISEQASDSFVSAKEFDSHGLSKDSKHLDISSLHGLGDIKESQDKDGLSVVVIGDAYKYKKIVLLISSKSGGLKFIPMVKDMKK